MPALRLVTQGEAKARTILRAQAFLSADEGKKDGPGDLGGVAPLLCRATLTNEELQREVSAWERERNRRGVKEGGVAVHHGGSAGEVSALLPYPKA